MYVHGLYCRLICPKLNSWWYNRWYVGSSLYSFSFLCPDIGVCQLVNKMEENSGKIKAFNRNDEEFLEAFVIFCGLGIQNTQMYEAVERAMAKQMVTLEVSPKSWWSLISPKQTLIFPRPCLFCTLMQLLTGTLNKDYCLSGEQHLACWAVQEFSACFWLCQQTL